MQPVKASLKKGPSPEVQEHQSIWENVEHCLTQLNLSTCHSWFENRYIIHQAIGLMTIGLFINLLQSWEIQFTMIRVVLFIILYLLFF